MIWLLMAIRIVILGLIIYGISTGKIARFYFWLMWIVGERDKDNNPLTLDDREFITYKLRRQVQRLGVWWWVLSLSTIVFLSWVLEYLFVQGYWQYFGWLDLVFYLWGVSLWLMPHVLMTAVFPPERKKR